MRALFLLLLIALSCASRAVVFDVFLQVSASDGELEGEASDPLYSGWIEVLGFESKSVQQSKPPAKTLITLVKPVDQATSDSFAKLCSFLGPLRMKLVVVSRTPQRPEAWEIAAEPVFLTRQRIEFSNDQLIERLTFEIGELECIYMLLSESGDPIAEIVNAGEITQERPPDYLGALDSDGDGIPDGWERFYELDAEKADANLDSDGDGMDNLREFVARTNPRSPQSKLNVSKVQKIGPTQYRVTWRAVKGVTYRVQVAPTPGGDDWKDAQVVTAGEDGEVSADVSSVAPVGFFRVITP